MNRHGLTHMTNSQRSQRHNKRRLYLLLLLCGLLLSGGFWLGSRRVRAVGNFTGKTAVADYVVSTGAAGTTITVNSAAQEATAANPNGVANSNCTLGEAILSANAGSAVGGCTLQGTGAPYTILLDQTTYTLTQPHNYEYGPNGLPQIASQIVINGNGGAVYTLAYGNKIEDGSASRARVDIQNCILANSLNGGGGPAPRDFINDKRDAGTSPAIGGHTNSSSVIFVGGNLVMSRASLSAATSTGAPTLTANPLLGPLQNNGGLTWTRALLGGSPAIDGGIRWGLLNDQRGEGFSRTVDLPAVANGENSDGTDLGAFEVQAPDLTLVKTDGGANFSFGSTLNYALTVSNAATGSPTTDPITVTDPLPTGLTLSSFSGAGWSCSGVGTGTANSQHAGPLPAGASLPVLMLTVSIGAQTPPSITNTATVATTGEGNTANNAGSDTTTMACPQITVLPANPVLSNGLVGELYSQSLSASPAGGNYNFAVTSGALPPGLVLNSSNGWISGRPTQTGLFNFRITATSFGVCSGSADYAINIAGCGTITLSPPSLAGGSVGSPYNQPLGVIPVGAYRYSVTSGALPVGLTMNATTGAITGTPATSGTFKFRVTASAGGCSVFRDYSLVIACPSLTISPASLPAGAIGAAYLQEISVAPIGSYSVSLIQGSLPPGVTLYGNLGMLFGYPATAGTFNFTITARAANTCTGSRQYSLTIGGAAVQSLVFGDFDGDGKADLSVWRGASGEWLTINSSNGQVKTEAWGSSAAPYFDVMTPGDYDGDGRMDLAVFRRGTGEWLIKRSQDGSVISKRWGVATDVPVPGDYDGDGKADGTWRIKGSRDNAIRIRHHGQRGDTPINQR